MRGLALALVTLFALSACNAALGLEEPSEVSRANCSVAPQLGCESGETCQVTDVLGNRKCVASGTSELLSFCSDSSECGPGLSCGPTARCVAFCKGTGDTSCNGECLQVFGANNVNVPHYVVCLPSCNPVDPSSCGDANCLFAPLTGNYTCGPQGAGQASESNACNGDAECQPGLTCVNNGISSACYYACRGDNDCPDGESCYPLSPPRSIDGTFYGACAFPSN